MLWQDIAKYRACFLQIKCTCIPILWSLFSLDYWRYIANIGWIGFNLHKVIDLLIDWLIDWLIDLFIDWFTHLLIYHFLLFIHLRSKRDANNLKFSCIGLLTYKMFNLKTVKNLIDSFLTRRQVLQWRNWLARRTYKQCLQR